MSAHTPAPWTNRGRYNALQDEIGVKDRAIAVVWTRQLPAVRDEKTGADSWPEGEANARLMIAAPLLLEALVSAAGALQGAAECMRKIDAPKTAARLEEIALASLLVIKEATGSEQP